MSPEMGIGAGSGQDVRILIEPWIFASAEILQIYMLAECVAHLSPGRHSRIGNYGFK